MSQAGHEDDDVLFLQLSARKPYLYGVAPGGRAVMLHTEQFRISPSIFKVPAPTILYVCPSMVAGLMHS